jgi:hypothetical protein
VVKLPYVLRERAEGVPMQTTAPSAPGTYLVTCAMDNRIISDGQTVRVLSDPDRSQFAPILELLKTEITPNEPQRGSELVATFFWRRRAELQGPILMQVQLLDSNGTVLYEVKRQPVSYTYPVRVWRDNELVADSYALPIPNDLPRGSYRIVIRAVDENTNAPVSFRNARGEPTTEFFTESFLIP